ncbi:dimethylmenaquinone methyltransferase [Rhodanobacter sp. FW510-R12]|uniref:FAD-binding oxidoreductase n=1 Tax=unclassified Rhodanobacter TaxID=2621553 RepID=UPI0007AA496A|nr:MULTISPECIES: FAD-linked oxidase C-terminal domain-containing protein [unclassified Rhodanobacter]KZC17232.1 dimethylmenaquinone methyltransferase [Rhodanobacter sp. FW104-R8]KZC29088.1 dimethylmenaquinone methyltransferase [Rhodanobacter sp. FW510-T8]KZC33026.1 dimethylmenaquinone methyltransferase [Rhodanobacter sp. FW510-R10]
MTLPATLLDRLRAIFPGGELSTSDAVRNECAHDNSRYRALPELVVFPTGHDQVEALVRACREHRVPLTARGGGTSSTGASVPMAGGVVANFMRMNRILRIDPDNRLAVVEPGVSNEALQQALAPYGFFWAPDPGSAPWCTVGGNLACNASGPHAVKYGSTRDNVLGLAAVAGSGKSFRCGTHTTKSAIGYDLTRLVVGSEGTLAVITEATLKLTPRPAAVRTLRATYRDVASAARAVTRIMAQPATPCALEFMDALALKLARDHQPEAGVPAAEALLMIELDGAPDTLDGATAAIEAAARVDGLVQLEVARDEAQTRALWAARKALSLAQRSVTQHKINEDVVVPVSRLPELVDGVRALSEKHAVPIVSFGHAGNGNLHVNLLPRDVDEIERAYAALPELFALVLALDGTISGEHGIGVVKREFMPLALEPATLELMRNIKAAFDPDGILNPGKLLP